MPVGYTTDSVRSRRKHLGFGVECDDGHLALDSAADGRQDKVPYSTTTEAQARLELIESLGFCRRKHRVVKVWGTYAGSAPKV